HALYHLVFASVRERLRAANLTPRLQAPSTLTSSQALGTAPPSGSGFLPTSWSLSAPAPPASGLPFGAGPSSPNVEPVAPSFAPTPPDVVNGDHRGQKPTEPRPVFQDRLRSISRRSNCTTPIWSSRLRKACWSSTSTPCTSVSCSNS